MVLYLQLDQHTWGVADFTDDNNRSLTGTIYSDIALSSAFDYTGYTLSFRFIDTEGRLIEDDEEDISAVTEASGTWRYKPDEGRLSTEAVGQVVIRLEKSGSQLSAIGINGSADLHIQMV